MLRIPPRLTSESLLRALLLSAALCGLLFLLLSGKILFFVHPRVIPLLKITVILLGLLLLFALHTLFAQSAATPAPVHCCCSAHAHHTTSLRWRKYSPFLLAALILLLVPTQPLNASLVDNKELNSRKTPAPSSTLEKQLQATPLIRLSDADFVRVASELNALPGNYIGKEIDFSGFAYRNAAMPDDTFSLARYVIACCAGDASPYGLLCSIPANFSFQTGHWYQAHGRLQRDPARPLAYVQIDWIREISVPPNPYVYP